MASLPPPSPLSRFGMILLGGALLLVLGLLWFAQHLADRRGQGMAAAGSSPWKKIPATVGNGVIRPEAVAEKTPLPPGRQPPEKEDAKKEAVRQLNGIIGNALAVLRDPANPNKLAALDALREALRRAEPAVAIAATRQFLATREDAPTGLRFKVGPNGALAEAPTLRTFLMDQLGSISGQAGVADAAEVGRETLATKTSPDEWALAMRNVAWADPQGSGDYLAAKARELITYTPWRQQPSGGYLEAFDVAAYSGDPTLLNDLAPLAAAASPVQQAALIAMDRLSATAPGKVSAYLNANPGILSDLPMVRADYMGKVDLSDPAQNAQAEAYLRRGDVSMEEKDKFLARLALPAGFVSDNLLTPAQSQNNNLVVHRTMVNQAATDWLNSGRFPALQDPLQKLVTSTAPGP